uniref:Transaldolase n=1 Tax=Romanomermis culicivorax TaxID=13658 RepID=A0A915K8I7_ROMCU
MVEIKSALDQIKQHTVIVADTGSFDLIKEFLPTDVTTNPSLLLQAASLPAYNHLLDAAVAYAITNA